MDVGHRGRSRGFICMLILGVPNSPRWLLVERGDKEGALQTLQLLHSNVQTAQAELKAIVAHQSQEVSSGNVFSGKYNKSLILAFYWPSSTS